MATTSISINDIAAEFANNVLGEINSAVVETVGVDVMWFRAMPDKRSQDVIFQSYTLYGVEDCPLEFKAVYMDTAYDDAAITFNIMGLEYSVPLTLDIPANTWYKVTNNDGTLPQRGDIVFIPMSRKLLEVVSMSPVKKIGAQIVSYKVNLSIYKPTRSRIVGENLRNSIEENTVNLDSRFGDDIDETIKNIVDKDQLSIFGTSEKDSVKENIITGGTESNPGKNVHNIIEHNFKIDNHIVSRSYYDANIGNGLVVRYKKEDYIKATDTRCLSIWVKICDNDSELKNIKKMTLSKNILTIEGVKKQDIGTEVLIARGNISITGKVISMTPYQIELNKDMLTKINSASNNWFNFPGFTIEKVNDINLIYGVSDTPLNLCLKSGKMISLKIGDTESLFRLTEPLKTGKWYGIVVNMGLKLSIDVYEEHEQLTNIIHMSNIRNKYWQDLHIDNYQILNSKSYLTNIRLYDVENTETDKQIIDLVTYNIPDNYHAVVNDSVDIYLDKKFTGIRG